MNGPYFFPADAHEGPVWVAEQCRLYFTTKTHLDGRREVDILFLDFSQLGFCDSNELWDEFPDDAPHRLSARLFRHDARMANSMCLGPNRRNLLVAEQGDKHRPAAISLLNLSDHSRKVVVDGVDGKAFNSPNKVVLSEAGHIIFSDPDYGFRQGFRPPPELEPNVYTYTKDGRLHTFRCGLEMPHGLSLTPDQRTLFITDTSDDGAHDDDVELDRRRSVWRFSFDASSGQISGEGECCFSVNKGVPDGSLTVKDYLLVGGGDGVYVADLGGKLQGKIPMSRTAVNLALAGNGKQLFVTTDEGVALYPGWERFVEDI